MHVHVHDSLIIKRNENTYLQIGSFNHTLQGIKLRLIQAPIRLNFSLW